MDSENSVTLSLKTLAEIGSFSGAPVVRRVKWKQPHKDNPDKIVEYQADVFVRPLSYATAVAEIAAYSKNEDTIAARISASIVDESGKPIFTPADITGDADPERGPLNGNLTTALLQAIAEVNALGKQ